MKLYKRGLGLVLAVMATFLVSACDERSGEAANGAAMAADDQKALLERGDYLMNGIVACGNCHTPKAGPLKGVEFAGGFVIKEPPFDAVAPNITPDKETGIGNWTDEQLITSIREGKRPDGTIIGPPMAIPFFRHISDRDVKALVVYMRQVKPVKNDTPPSVYRIPLPPSYGPPVESVPEPDKSDKVAYGEYLATIGHCVECHTPMVKGRRDYENRKGAGGFEFHGPWGTSVSRNITSSKEAGLGNWTDAEIKRAITKGIRKDGSKLMPPMAYSYYDNIAEEDLDAIVAYLRTLPPVD